MHAKDPVVYESRKREVVENVRAIAPVVKAEQASLNVHREYEGANYARTERNLKMLTLYAPDVDATILPQALVIESVNL